MQKEDIAGLKKRLQHLLKSEALKKGKFALSSGQTSNFYLDGRVITLSPEGAYLVARIILDALKNSNVDAVGGPTLGADPIVGAIACLSHLQKIPLKTFIVRRAPKEHGAQRQIEGPALAKNSRVILVDDVSTTGKALIGAKQALESLGIACERAIVIVDRCEGAAENLAREGLRLESIFKLEDLGMGI